MPPLNHGWYCFLAMNSTDEVATDRYGPFLSLKELLDWLNEHDVELRPYGKFFEHAPLYFGEMTGDESSGAWATGIYEVK